MQNNNSSSSNESKPARDQFKCYHCRQLVLKKDGDWYNWDQMQVHLCRKCAASTEASPQRNRGRK